MTPEERRQLLEESRYCVVSYNRKSGPPAQSPVYYVLDGDDLLISTTATRAKGRVFSKPREVSVCVLSEKPHPSPPYVTIYGTGTIETEGAVDLMMRIGHVMRGEPVPESARPAVEERAKNEQRVVLRIRPERYVDRDS